MVLSPVSPSSFPASCPPSLRLTRVVQLSVDGLELSSPVAYRTGGPEVAGAVLEWCLTPAAGSLVRVVTADRVVELEPENVVE